MKRTDNYFLISKYNQDSRYLLEYCKDYIIYDQSTDMPHEEKNITKSIKKIVNKFLSFSWSKGENI